MWPVYNTILFLFVDNVGSALRDMQWPWSYALSDLCLLGLLMMCVYVVAAGQGEVWAL